IARRFMDGIASHASRIEPLGSAEIFAEILVPPPRLLVFGADDDARPICRLASAVGFRVTIVDHRPAFLEAGRFPDAERRLLLRPEGGAAAAGSGPRTSSVGRPRRTAPAGGGARAPPAGGAEPGGLLGPRARPQETAGEIGPKDAPRVYGPVGL